MDTSDIIAIIAAVISLGSVIFAFITSHRATALQTGMVELTLRQAVENAKSNINKTALEINALRAKETLTEKEKAAELIYQSIFDSTIESKLNIYDSACAKYIDGKIDKDRFKKDYHIEIRNLVNDEDLKKQYFDPTTSSYKPILKVYKEWNDLEK